ncbi:pyruvate formate lyase activating enzyme [Caloramator fervidus]|uniref:Pyruvate formate lyase activating enzyme n=1 Tax=Caloramator fervidus TaxID=29344 RepID=A0A1H5TTB0_9CLOT|nr:AmmeMemoRadiSam system radical SAM enzyme [Caloramator fervidus]SEF65227.1 pyruvate formate lyase activating enzyme [Caloramator fervidus]
MIKVKEAMFYTKDNDKIVCKLCPHNCLLSEEQIGFCRSRKVINNKLYSLNYGKISAINLDPIEKKPLYHYKPGSYILSVGSFGCNFNCHFCQNYSISQFYLNGSYVMPSELIELALKYKSMGNIGIAFTYNEPSIFYEYIYDVVEHINEDLDIVLVTNGFINIEPLEKIIKKIKAVNIDLKAFNNKFYKEICHGNLQKVLETIKFMCKFIHVEITTLIIPNLNDSKDEINDLALWLSKIDKNIPLHLTRYFPAFKLEKEPTPINTLIELKNIAKQHLNYVYIGNTVALDNNTYCPNCKGKLIERMGFNVKSFLTSNKCPFCGYELKRFLTK